MRSDVLSRIPMILTLLPAIVAMSVALRDHRIPTLLDIGRAH